MHGERPVYFQRYVALGDSSTEGVDDPDGAGGYRGWSQRLAEKISGIQGGLDYANFGVRGLTTAQVRESQLAEALALQPDLATVFSGTNDVIGFRFDADRVAADFEHMQRELVAAGAVVLSFTLPDPGGLCRARGRHRSSAVERRSDSRQRRGSCAHCRGAGTRVAAARQQ